MKRILILFSLILIFGVIRGQSDYEKYGYPVFKKPYDTTNSWLKKNISLTSVSPTVLTGQIFGGKDIQVFPSNTSQSEVHISIDTTNSKNISKRPDCVTGNSLQGACEVGTRKNQG